MTNPSFILPAVQNNVTTPQLLGAIGAGDTTLVLKSGHGALFPTIYRNTCSSTGSSTALNSTGNLGSVAVGDFIHNLTDGSSAVVTSISGAPNSIVTTPLEGGSLNVWTSGDVWIVNMFVVTGVHFDTDGTTVLKRERMKVTNRVTDTLTVVRAYDGDSAQTFSGDDYVQLLVEKSQIENLQKAVRNIIQREYSDHTAQATLITNLQKDAPMWLGTITGTNTLTGDASPALTAYAAGQRVAFIVANNNSGAVTINVNSLGAKTITRMNGATALVTGDFIAGQVVMLQYDGTNFQMLTPNGTTAAPTVQLVYTNTADSNTISGTTSEVDFDTQYTVPANGFVAGGAYRIKIYMQTTETGTPSTFKIYLGSDIIATSPYGHYSGTCMIDCLIVCRTTGATGTILSTTVFLGQNSAETQARKEDDIQADTIDTTTPKLIKVSSQSQHVQNNYMTIKNMTIERLG